MKCLPFAASQPGHRRRAIPAPPGFGFLVALVGLLLIPGAVVRGATVTWDGGAGDGSWHAAANWSGNILPGADDDVVIEAAGGGPVVFSQGTTRIRSLECHHAFVLAGGDLVLNGGASTFSGALRLEGGTLMVLGDDTACLATGETTHTATDLYAADGGSLRLPALVAMEKLVSGELSLTAVDPGSLIELAAATRVSVADFYQFAVYAYNGGTVRLPALTTIHGALEVFADGDDSQVDLAALGPALVNATRGTARIEVRSGATVLLPRLRTMDQVHLMVREDGGFPLDSLTAFTRAELALDARVASLPGLTNLHGANLNLQGAAELHLPGVTQLTRTQAGHLVLNVIDAGSLLDLPAVTAATVPDFYQLDLLARDGGRIALPRLATMNGAISAFAEGEDSRVELPGLAGVLEHRSRGNAVMEAREGGVVWIPNLTGLDRVQLVLRDGGQMPLAQVTSVTGAALVVEGQSLELPGLTNVLGSNLFVEGGGLLDLPGVRRLVRTNSGSLTLFADGEASRLRLPNVVEASVTDYYQLEVLAHGGGRIELPRLASIQGSLEAFVRDEASWVDLSGLAGTLRDVSHGTSTLEVRSGATLVAPRLTGLDRVRFVVRGNGQSPLPQLTGIVNASLLVEDLEISLPLLADLRGTSVTAEEGARVTLGGVSQLSRTPSGSLTLTADGEGSLLRFPNVTSVSVPDYYQLELVATDGGRIELPRLTRLDGALDAFAEDAGSTIDLSGWTGTLANATPGTAYLTVEEGASILLPQVTTIDHFILRIRGTGSMTTAQLLGLTHSQVTIDAATVEFGALQDTTGTTFEYLNGGTAVFREPVDLLVRDLRAPAVVRARQPFEVSWEIVNQGTPLAASAWSDALVLSADAVPGEDRWVGLFPAEGALAAGGTRRITNTVVLGPEVAGVWHLGVVVNHDRRVFEGILHANNTNIASALLEVQAPDLVVDSPAVVPSAAALGASVTVQWRVRNAGTAPVEGGWIERVRLASSPTGAGDSVILLARSFDGPLAAGASVSRSALVALPLTPGWAAGPQSVVIEADAAGMVPESNETNNAVATGLTVSLPPLPDLAVASLRSSGSARPGELLEIVWTATNRGPARVSGSWTAFFQFVGISPAAPARLLATATLDVPLPAAGSLSRTQLVAVPDLQTAGTGELRVLVDAGNAILEADEGNNVGVGADPLTIPAVLQVRIPVAELREDTPGGAVTALVTRNGDRTVPLVVGLASSDVTEVTVPSSVAFAAGEASATFPITVVADATPDEDQQVTITATAAGYPAGDANLLVLNADLPRLTLSPGSATVAEGQSAGFTVSRQGRTGSLARVTLASPSGAQVLLPDAITLAPGQTSQSFSVVAIDDTQIEALRSVRIDASSAGHTGASATLVVTDNDLPDFTLALAATTVREDAGVAATTLTVSRGAPSPRSLSVALENSHPGAAQVPPRVILPAGQATVSVPVAVTDNSQVDGTRTAVFQAFAESTSSGARVAQSATVTLTITDEDGPALALALDRDLAAEGVAGAATLTVVRNDPATGALEVALSSSDPSEATVPASIVIPAGQDRVEVPVTTLDDGDLDGSQGVQINASAPGHAPASVTLVVTDIPRPDLVATDVAGPARAETEAFVNVAYRIRNQGLAAAGTNWVTRVFLSRDPLAGDDDFLAESVFSGTLPVGQFFGQSRQVRLPLLPGDYWVVVTTDLANQIGEVREDNNTTVSSAPIRVAAAYDAVVAADLTSAPAGTPVPLRGTATRTATGGPAPFVLVNLHLHVRGTHRVISALTDEAGRFAVTFQPLPGEAGLYEVGAAHPGAGDAPLQDSFTLHGLRVAPIEPVRLTERSSVTGTFVLENLGDRPLSGLAVTVVSNLARLEVTTSLPPGGALPGAGTAPMGFAFTAGDDAAGEGFVVLRVTSAEGAVLNVPVPVRIDAVAPRLVARPQELIAGVKAGGQALVTFALVNEGGSASGPVQILAPSDMPWLHVVSANPAPSIAPGASHPVTLQLTPPADLPLGAHTGRLLASAGAVTASVPFQFRALSEARGDLRLTAVDEYTYYAEGSPRIAGAEVTLRDAVNDQIVASGVTDAAGEFVARQVPEGYYDLQVRADQHGGYREPHLVVAGFETNITAFLPREAVRYRWTVVPTEIEDRTRITLETLFEAFVPMPVVTVDPALIDLDDYPAEVTQIEMRITNHGLVAAQKARIGFGTHPDWEFLPLITELGDLPARSTLTVPLLIRRVTTPGDSRALASLVPVPVGSGSGRRLTPAEASFHAGWRALQGGGGGGCGVGGVVEFEIPCGPSTQGGGAPIAILNAGGSGCGGGGGGFAGGGQGGSGSSNGGGGGAGGGSSSSIDSCDPCLLEILKCLIDFILPDVLSCFKNLASCLSPSGDVVSAERAWECTKAALACAEALGGELSMINKAIDAGECAINLAKACGSPAGGGGSGGGGGGEGGGGTGGSRLSLQRDTMTAERHATGVSRVERAELTILRQRAEWVLRQMAPLRYLFGSDIWFSEAEPVSASAWLATFQARIEPGTDAGIRISPAEIAQLAAVPLPSAITPADQLAFVQRWNRSVDYWEAGIVFAAQVPAGQNPDFIALDTLRAMAQGQIETDAECVAAGFRSPSEAFQRASAEIVRFLGEGDSGGVCAHVRLQIQQELISTRDAFDATLEIDNALPEVLDEISVELLIRRRSGEDATGLFGVYPPALTGLTAVDGTGVLGPASIGRVRWVLVPSADAATAGPEEYLVAGLLRYRQGALQLTVPLAPASITVSPSPSLAVKYFHQRDVFADDPFTVEVEPSVPFSLAVLVENRGHGAARNVRIASAQPRIVDNDKGLLVDFKILATEVAGQNLDPNLTVEFGRIDPGTNAIGRWLLTSTILGGFLEYSATFEHLNGLGDKRLSLVEGIEIHELIHIVRAPGTADDQRPDFLVNDVADLLDTPDTLHLSDGRLAPVSVVLDAVTDGAPRADDLEVELTADTPGGWVYLRIPDPGQGEYRLVRVLRSDGVEVPFGDNAWTTDRTFLGNARRPIVEHTVHLFDGDSPGRYTLVYAATPAGDRTAPESQVATLPAENAAVFPVRWSGEDNPGGGGIQFFDVYVSIDGEPFDLWQWETLDQGAVYQGALGRTYAFYSVATDLAGNREEDPPTPDAVTRVTRINRAPTLAAIPDLVVREGETLIYQPTASDPDGDELVFSLSSNAPPGVVVHPYTGRITWVTGEGNGPASHGLTLQVLDNGAPRLGAQRAFQVVVRDDNSPPVLAGIPDRTLAEGQTLAFTCEALDPDLPAQVLTFSLGPGAPAGATLDPASGAFSWTPQDFQGGASYDLVIEVRDNGTPPLVATRSFRVTVRDTRSDYTLRLGSTNLVAGAAQSIPLVLSSGADLAWIEFQLVVTDPHLTAIELLPVGGEIAFATLDPVGEGRFAVRMDFDPDRVATGDRVIGRLAFDTEPVGASSAVTLGVASPGGARTGGEGIVHAGAWPGRIFILEDEPLIDAAPAPGGNVVLVVYGDPGTTYQLQSSSLLGPGAAWRNDATVVLSGAHAVVTRPLGGPTAQYWRVVRP